MTCDVHAQRVGANPLGDGTGLHNNLQVNSSGVNGLGRRNNAGRYADAIVTGNVAGLARFRGGIDYSAVGEFRGVTAGDDTFRFRAAAVDPGAVSGHAARGRRGESDFLLIYRSATGTRAGDLTRGYANVGPTKLRDDVSALNVRTSGAAGARPLNQTWRLPAARESDDNSQSPSPGQLLARPDVATPLVLPPSSMADLATEKIGALPSAATHLRVVAESYSTLIATKPLSTSLAKPDVANRPDVATRPERSGLGAAPVRGMVVVPTEAAGSKEREKSLIERIAEEFAATNAQRPATNGEAADLAATLRFDPNRVPIATLVPEDDGPYKAAMAEGEQLMAAGKFFQAEEAYDRAIRLRGDDPMPRVGRAHAELGAGLYLAAAYQLRQTFTAFPRVIPNRYSGDVLPGNGRIVEIEAELTKLLDQPERKDAPLLLAYLSYQQNRTTMVANALATLSRRAGRDPLAGLLMNAWTGKAADPAPPTLKKP